MLSREDFYMIKQMRQQGAYIVDIATQIGCSERTVRRYLKYPEPPARKTRHKMVKLKLNRPGFPGECFICELRLPDHRFRWKHNKLFLLLPEEYGPAFPAIVDCYTSPPT